MLASTTCARACAALSVIFLSSSAIAQVSAVSDRGSLDGTHFVDWQDYSVPGTLNWVYSPETFVIHQNSGANEVVGSLIVEHTGTYYSYIYKESEYLAYGGDTPMLDTDYLYQTVVQDVNINPINFSSFDGLDVCALGTQIVPLEPGLYEAKIEAFDATGESIGAVPFYGAHETDPAVFVGIESNEPMARVELSLQLTGGGFNFERSWYAINQVDLRACDLALPPEAPMVTCEGFASPMDQFPVKTKKNRVFPLKMELIDADGFELTGADLAAPPVVTVTFTPEGDDEGVDVSADALATGQGSEGNQFVYTDEGIWQYNLKSKDHSAAGTYLVTAVSGDESEYTFDESCVTSFVK